MGVNTEAANLIEWLDKYPHIQKKLDLYWGYKECRDYLGSLTMSDRPNRQGFPLDTVMVIDELIDLHDSQFPTLKPKTIHNVW